MKKAAQDLTALVRGQILAKGGKYVAVFNLPDSGLTPFGSTLPALVAVGAAVLRTTIDFRPTTLSAGVSYKF